LTAKYERVHRVLDCWLPQRWFSHCAAIFSAFMSRRFRPLRGLKRFLTRRERPIRGLLDLQRRSRKLTGHVDITEIRVEVGQVCLFPVALNFNQQTIRCELLSCKGAPWHHVTFFVTRAVVEADNSHTCFAVTKAGGWWCKLRFLRRPPIVRRVFENSDGLRLAVTPSYHSSAVQKQTAQSMHVVASM
jgi:hypothetical protein